METVQTASSTPQMTYLRDYQVPPYFIETVDLVFELGEEKTRVKNLMHVKKNPESAQVTPHLVLAGEELTLISIKINGQLLEASRYAVTDRTLTILNVPSEFDLEIINTNSPIKNTALTGLYVSSNNFCTQCEAEGFRRITYFLDRPDVMAKYTTTIHADQKRYPVLLSNGNPIDQGQSPEGRHWIKWQDPFKKPCYLFALVAGDFDCLTDEFITQSGRKVELRIYVEKGNLNKTAFAMQAVKKAMRWDEKTFGREYDLDIYMIVAVSDFNMGAMENKGLNIFNTKYILASPETATDQDYINIEAVIAHEYFHNWSGNRITCRDWFQLSLKEGLTIFRDQSFTMDTTSPAVARIQDVTNLRNVQFAEDASPLAHPVRPDCYIEINNFYTPTVYEKGSEVIRMMQTILGKALFRKGMDLYFSRHDGQAVTIEEFVKAMEDASQVDLKQFRLWYSQAGTPCLEVHSHYEPNDQLYQLTISQTCPETINQKNKLPMHIPVSVGLLSRTGKELKHEVLHLKKSREQFDFHEIAEEPIPSLLRGFSAPVKLNYPYQEEELLFLLQHDTDEFNRWEAGQIYTSRLILNLIQQKEKMSEWKVPEAYLKTIESLLQNKSVDPLMLSEFMTLPSEKYLGEQMSVIDVDAIHWAREFVLSTMAERLKPILMTLYQENHEYGIYHFDMTSVGKRSLKNLCLGYLMLSSTIFKETNWALNQFNQSLKTNMTDTLAALRCLSNIDTHERHEVLNAFYQQWQKEALVVDKWLLVQAITKLPSALKEVVTLSQHAAFDIKNPNKVYSLIGGFCQNAVHFHEVSGAGYAFLAETVQKLDRLNPQVAARMVKPLMSWKRYDHKRQKLMHAALEQLLKTKSLSEDVYELVEKSL